MPFRGGDQLLAFARAEGGDALAHQRWVPPLARLSPLVLVIACTGSIIGPLPQPVQPVVAPRCVATGTPGAEIYASTCATCHGALISSQKIGADAVRIQHALVTIPEMIEAKVGQRVCGADIDALVSVLTPPAKLPTCDTPIVGHTPTVRLCNVEYDNTMRDLLGVGGTTSSDHSFATDDSFEKFTNIAGLANDTIQPTQLDTYLETAFALADTVLSTKTLYSKFFADSCFAAGAPDCKPAVIRKLVSLAFRRPVTDAENATYQALYAGLIADGQDWQQALRWTFAAALTSPNFLFKRIDQPVGTTGVTSLSQYELASRMSYFLWQSLPDDALLAAAAKSELSTGAQLDAQVKRMLQDPRAEALIDTFFTQWFELNAVDDASPSAAVYPHFSESIRGKFKTEARLFFKEIIRGDHSLYDLLHGNYTFADAELAQFYGVAAPSSSTDFSKVDLTGSHRAGNGVLGLGSILTLTSRPDETSVVRRGRWLMDNLLCPPPTPLPDATIDTSVVQGLDPADAVAYRKANPQCASCHAKMDPIGISLEHFDGIGQYRTSYPNAKMVNSNGQLPDGTQVDSATALGEVLGASDQFKACVVKKMVMFSLNRAISTDDRCTVNTIALAHVTPSTPVSAVISAIVQNDVFTKQAGE